MVVSELQHKETYQQIIHKASDEINVLLANDDQLRQDITDAENQLAAIDESERQTKRHLSATHAALETAIREYGEAKTYAELAVNTPGERNSILALRDAERKKLDQERSYQTEKKLLDQELAEIPRRRQIRQDIITSSRKQLFDNSRKRAYLQANRNQASDDLGLLLLAESQARISKLQDDLKEKQIEVASMEQSLAKAVQEEAEKLIQYPEHANMIKNTLPYQDATTRILEASRNLLALLLDEGIQIDIDPVLLRQVNGYASITDLLSWDIQILESAIHGGNKRRLEERLDNITWLLDQYREEKQ